MTLISNVALLNLQSACCLLIEAKSIIDHNQKLLQAVNDGLKQGCQTQFLEGRSPAEFCSNTHTM